MSIIEVSRPDAGWSEARPRAERTDHAGPATPADVCAAIAVQIGKPDRGVELRAVVEFAVIAERCLPERRRRKAGFRAERADHAGGASTADVRATIVVHVGKLDRRKELWAPVPVMGIIEVPAPQGRRTKAVSVAELAEHTLPAAATHVRATIVVQIGEADRGVELRALVELVGITGW